MDINKTYKNGQRQAEQIGDIRVVYFKSGAIKAKGKYVSDMMQGRWIFNRESGSLWQEGHFLDNQKHGDFKRYTEDGALEYHAVFENGKQKQKIV